MIPSLICLLFVWVGPWLSNPSSLLQSVRPGDVPQYTFRRPLLNGMGTESLADLRGKPVFIEFWGRGQAAVDEGMSEALVWQSAYGDDLTVLFVEVKKATDLQVTSLALKKKWLGGRAMWTTEVPCRVGVKGALPQFILLSSEGVVLLKGTTESYELGYRDAVVEALEDNFREEAERRREGPVDLPERLVPAWEAFADGRIEHALDLAHASADGAESDGTVIAAARETQQVFRERLRRRLELAAWQIENGYLLQAEEELDRLEGQLGSEASLAERHSALDRALHAESLNAEWKAAKDLAKLEKKLYASGSKSLLVKLLGKLAKKHSGTKSGERAANLFEAAQVSPYK